MNQKTINYLVGLGALVGLLWSGASQWFELKYRVLRLEETSHYMHGDVTAFLPKEP